MSKWIHTMKYSRHFMALHTPSSGRASGKFREFCFVCLSALLPNACDSKKSKNFKLCPRHESNSFDFIFDFFYSHRQRQANLANLFPWIIRRRARGSDTKSHLISFFLFKFISLSSFCSFIVLQIIDLVFNFSVKWFSDWLSAEPKNNEKWEESQVKWISPSAKGPKA